MAARYDLPPNAPQGNLRIASFGLASISEPDHPKGRDPALHLRLVVTNNSGQPWTVDTREQRLDLRGQLQEAPLFVTSREGQDGLPLVSVPAGGKRVIDLFFPLPSDDASNPLPEFDALWKVQTATQVVADRTPFERLQYEPEYTSVYADPDWGYYGDWAGPLWFNGWYGGGGWRGGRFAHYGAVRHSGRVRSAPSWRVAPPPAGHFQGRGR